ncbi:MAG: hypothetical protein K2P79_01980 [Sphingomonas sp.]|nr:hypothetical protein [Sphingomonas sp.]
MRNARRELLVFGAIVLFGLVYLGMSWETRASSSVAGRVLSINIVEGEHYGEADGMLRAQVGLPGVRTVSVPLPRGSRCRIGSPIQLVEASTLFGSRFKVGLRECALPADFRAGQPSK